MPQKLFLLAPIIAVATARSFGYTDEPRSGSLTHDVPTRDEDSNVPPSYGIDVSFPTHHLKVTDNYAWLEHNVNPSITTPIMYKDMVVQPLGDMQSAYNDFIQGCIDKWPNKASRCISTEEDRIAMSLRQPQSMRNYTDTGFKKIRAPQELWSLLKNFWDENRAHNSTEKWGIGNTYTNNWASPSAMVSVEDKKLRGGGFGLKQKIWDETKKVVSAWTGQELTQCSLYGIRIYQEGAILAPHVDRLPLVSSAIVNVAQDVDEPWILEVFGHDGKATNVTMEPGDMVLYESHSVIHGRPYPLKGRYMANIFIHFEPVGHSLMHNAESGGGDVNKQYREAVANGVGGHEHDGNDGLPIYILKGSPEERHWRERHPTGLRADNSNTPGSTEAHEAAKTGNVARLQREITKTKTSIHAKDSNGWTPLHEGARGGHLEIVKLLVDNGADLNHKTSNGATALWWAKQSHDVDHPVVQFLENLGANTFGPEL